MFCSELTAINSNDQGGQACLLHCRRWTCDKCLPLLRRGVVNHARDGHPTAMLTLTCNPANHESPDDAAQDMRRAWVLMRKKIAKRFGITKLPFIVVFERHKSGWPHMHLLIRAPFLAQKWLSLEWQKLTGAMHVDIRKIRGPREAARYVAKYIGKEPFAFEGCKRWWRSHNYDESEDDGREPVRFGQHWHRTRKDVAAYSSWLRALGATITEARPGYVRWSRGATGPPPDFDKQWRLESRW